VKRAKKYYTDDEGNKWEVWVVTYKTNRYALGGKDEVFQFKLNGVEIGHHTRHLDAKGELLKMNKHNRMPIPKKLTEL
jgi:hypothetical protein